MNLTANIYYYKCIRHIMNIHESALHKCKMICAGGNIYSILERKIISMEEKKQLRKKEMQNEIDTRKS